MQDPVLYIIVAAFGLASVALLAQAALKGWREWIALKHSELRQHKEDTGQPSATSRIEVADLKERIRKLEAIAAGVDI